MARFRLTIPTTWATPVIASLRKAYGEAAGDLARSVEKEAEHARFGRDGGRLFERNRADETRKLIRQLERALDQFGWDEGQEREQDVVLASDARGIGVALRGVLDSAANWDLRSCENVSTPASILVDGRLQELARMLTSLERPRGSSQGRSTRRV